jgi:hypothetical protein
MWQPRATLIVLTDIDEHESDFNRWYDEEHSPRRAALPGVKVAYRFVRADAPVPPSSSGSPQLLTPPSAWSPTAWTTRAWAAARPGWR